MNTETIAPWRSFAEEIFLAFVCSPLTAGLFSVDHSKSTAPWFVWQPYHRSCPPSSSRRFWLEIDEWDINLSLLYFPSFLPCLQPHLKMTTLRKGVNLFQLSVCLLSFSSQGKIWHFYHPEPKRKIALIQIKSQLIFFLISLIFNWASNNFTSMHRALWTRRAFTGITSLLCLLFVSAPVSYFIFSFTICSIEQIFIFTLNGPRSPPLSLTRE